MKENKTFEIKEKITNTFLKTVSAYANFCDGVIQFGITDDGVVIGVENTKDACLDIENKINDSISPTPDFAITVDNKTNVIMLEVYEGQFKPYYYKGKAYKRNDTATIEVDRIELNRLVLEGENRTYDELVTREENLEFTVLEKKFKERLKIEYINQDILKTIGLLDIEGRFNNAGALLADENRAKGIDCARFGESIDIILDREIYENESILKMYDDAISLYRKYYQYDEIKGAYRNTIEIIPEEAFRETIANALVHRAWDIGSHIRVAMYEDKIEVFSPGGLPKGITQAEYLKGRVSVLRNPVIGSVFFRLHLIESFGTGVQRINAAYADSKTKPRHEFTENTIKVTLPVIRTDKGLAYDEEIVFNSISKVRESSSLIAEYAGFGKNKTLKLLTQLEEKGYVSKTGNGRGTRYSKN